jgi:hypothetical protein
MLQDVHHGGSNTGTVTGFPLHILRLRLHMENGSLTVVDKEKLSRGFFRFWEGQEEDIYR